MEDNVYIVPSERWPRFFFTRGVYDMAHDKIFVKGGLPEAATEEVIRHEKAHEKWCKNNPRIARIVVWGWGKPAIYFDVAIAVGFLSLVFLAFKDAAFNTSFMQLSLGFLVIHLLIWVLLEIPTWRMPRLSPKNKSERRESIRQGFFPFAPLVILFLLGIMSRNQFLFIFLIDLGVLLAWVLQLYNFFYVLMTLRRATGVSGG